MIDWERVNVLRDEVGPDDFEEVIELFLEEVEEVIGKLRTAPDPTNLEEDLHFLKGSAMSLGFTAFADLCQLGETLSAQGQSDQVDVPPIVASFDNSKRLFLEEMPTSLAG